MFNVVHVTHEAVYKMGGIGTVLEGLINSRPYRDAVGRTLLVCPMFYPERLERFGPGGAVEYSSLDHIHESPHADAFRQIEREWCVHFAYGQRPIEDEATARRTMCEVLLVDLRWINRARVNDLKGLLWEYCGLQSNRHEHVWDFEQYVQIAGPAAAALEALRIGGDAQPAIILAHEYMGLPTALAAALHQPKHYRTLFHAHEVATMRRIVEEHPGHDVMFYNVLETARRSGLYLRDVFGPQDDYFKHAIIETSKYCDGTLAVGHHVVRELQFLGSDLEKSDITLAYNGIASSRITPPRRAESRQRLRDYCASLLGWRPDHVFTHVTRLVRSKALWRDLQVLNHMDGEFGKRGQSVVLLVLSTELPRRSIDDVLRMEREWDWPLAHREIAPDLTPGEAAYYRWVQSFNARARNIHVIYINQFGFSPEACGSRVPAGVEFMDLRYGSDAEFGLSLYEPFGISPLEPLSYGGVCVVSTSCGCAGAVKQLLNAENARNIVLADYIHAEADRRPQTVKQAIEIGEQERRAAEERAAEVVARELLRRLPTNEAEERELLETGHALAEKLSWDAVAERFILPAMRRASTRRLVYKLSG
ncbi:MAG: hypothetical protein AB7Q17_00965 [Phycisphaerae bacterium]